MPGGNRAIYHMAFEASLGFSEASAGLSWAIHGEAFLGFGFYFPLYSAWLILLILLLATSACVSSITVSSSLNLSQCLFPLHQPLLNPCSGSSDSWPSLGTEERMLGEAAGHLLPGRSFFKWPLHFSRACPHPPTSFLLSRDTPTSWLGHPPLRRDTKGESPCLLERAGRETLRTVKHQRHHRW